jgi:hypothetical protein
LRVVRVGVPHNDWQHALTPFIIQALYPRLTKQCPIGPGHTALWAPPIQAFLLALIPPIRCRPALGRAASLAARNYGRVYLGRGRLGHATGHPSPVVQDTVSAGFALLRITAGTVDESHGKACKLLRKQRPNGI